MVAAAARGVEDRVHELRRYRAVGVADGRERALREPDRLAVAAHVVDARRAAGEMTFERRALLRLERAGDVVP